MSGGRTSLLPDERRRLIAERLRQRGSVSVAGLEAEFSISPMTARRDLDELERLGVARRTHGGAVLPGLSRHEDSFLQRLEVAVEAKERLAEAALALIEPGEALFVDSSTTGYIAARRIVRENVRCTLLTNSIPIMQLVCEHDAPQVEMIGAGGTLRKLTRSFVGPQAVRGIEAHFADHVLFSVRGLTNEGFLTDPDRSRRGSRRPGRCGSGTRPARSPPGALPPPSRRGSWRSPTGARRSGSSWPGATTRSRCRSSRVHSPSTAPSGSSARACT